ncbi:MAG TPA: sugar phosphate isomerase/epimerase [Chitinophagaceae bacterium]|nr:sugar phosphate isomerase/epimerase [Chitinophagaceae bacterium]
MNRSFSRRKFLQSTGMAAAGTLLAKNAFAEHPGYKIKNFGLQLWTVREDMAKDPRGTLKQIAKFGYTEIEGFEGPQGMFWGMTPADFEKYTRDELGIRMIGSHCSYSALTGDKNSLEGKAVQAISIGMPYLICPYKGPQKSIDDFKRIAEEFNKAGEVCKRNGVTYGYHNHDYTFKPVDGQIPMDVLLENTDHESVVFEMDIYWAITAGVDPEHYFNKYNKRFRLVHVKDRKKDAAPTDTDASCDLGTGSIDWPHLLHRAKYKGVRYFIVEQERFDNSTPMQSAEVDAKYLKPLIPKI